jgi:hypothetical protein
MGEAQLLVFPLNVQEGDVFTLDAHFLNSARSDDYPMYATVVRDANGQLVASDFSERLPQWLSVRIPVYTVAGALPYRLELAAIPLYNAGYVVRFGEFPSDNISYSVQLQPGNTAIEDAGLLSVGSRVDGVLSRGKPVIYTLDVAEEATMTLRREFAQTSGSQFLLNANGDILDISPSGIHVMSLVGPAPYTYYLEGEGSYTLLLEEGDTMERNELGRLAPGEVVRGTMPAPSDSFNYIALDVNPEATVTLNWGAPQMDYYIEDSTGTFIYSSNDSWTDGYAIVDLSQGTPPFVVEIGFDPRSTGHPYTFTLAEGETPLSPDEATAANTAGSGDTSTEAETQSGAATDSACTVSASSDINQRSGPGTNFEVSGTLAGGANASVDGQTTGADGFRWYRLTTGGWVRGDLVTATGGCSNVAEAAP